MTRTTPFRLISLHFSQMRLMLDRTFMIHPGPAAGTLRERENRKHNDVRGSDNPGPARNSRRYAAKLVTHAGRSPGSSGTPSSAVMICTPSAVTAIVCST